MSANESNGSFYGNGSTFSCPYRYVYRAVWYVAPFRIASQVLAVILNALILVSIAALRYEIAFAASFAGETTVEKRKRFSDADWITDLVIIDVFRCFPVFCAFVCAVIISALLYRTSRQQLGERVNQTHPLRMTWKKVLIILFSTPIYILVLYCPLTVIETVQLGVRNTNANDYIKRYIFLCNLSGILAKAIATIAVSFYYCGMPLFLDYRGRLRDEVIERIQLIKRRWKQWRTMRYPLTCYG